MAAAWSVTPKFLIVKAELSLLDPYGLLAGGAPTNEFDDEAREISQRITPTSSAQDIAEAIAAVLNNAFGQSDGTSIYHSAAKRIRAALKAV